MKRISCGLAAAVLWWAMACSDSNSSPSSPTYDSLPGLVVSPLVSHSSAGAHIQASGGSGGPVTAYVSLLPGSVPSGLAAMIRDPSTGAAVSVEVVDGGFDPVPIPAKVGDTLVVNITRSGAGTLLATQIVPANRPPVIVRSDPAPKKVDVPLNASIIVVFSTPIDSTTLSASSVQLWNDATPVTGTVRLADSSGFRVAFRPDLPLDVQTLYDLLVTQGVRDVNGATLATTVDIEFTTGTTQEALVFTALSVSAGYTCGLTTSADAYCWGVNSEGELGTTTNLECGIYCSTIPLLVADGHVFLSISTGLNHACGITTDRSAYCWGSSTWRQLGTDSATLSTCAYTPYYGGCPYPVPVAGGLTFQSIAAGFAHTCGLTSNATAYCWGRNASQELGADSATLAASCKKFGCPTPVPVSGGITFASLSAGNALTCGLTVAGAAYCWGADDVGQLGLGSTAAPEMCGDTLQPRPCSHTPLPVTGGLVFATVAAGDSVVCGLTTVGAAYCWGYNGGVMGSAVPLGSVAAAPTQVAAGLTFVGIAVGHQYACGVMENGDAYCWGMGDNGVLGTGATVHYNATPLRVVGGHQFVAVGAASGLGDHTCALAPDGTAFCWGANVEGQLGNGSTTTSEAPAEVLGQ